MDGVRGQRGPYQIRQVLQVTCRTCGKEFEAYRKSRAFCSDYCKYKSKHVPPPPKENATCPVCDKVFLKNKRHQRYCSPECYSKGWVKENREWANKRQRIYMKNRRDAARKPRHCPFCDKEFLPDHDGGKYCSVDCRNKHFRRLHPDKAKKYQIKSYEKQRILYPWRTLLYAARKRAIDKNLTYNLDSQWCVDNWTGKCALTGIPFSIGARRTDKVFSGSIDRIDPNRGYEKDNCRFVLWMCNSMKHDGSDADVFRVAEALVEMQRKDSE